MSYDIEANHTPFVNGLYILISILQVFKNRRGIVQVKLNTGGAELAFSCINQDVAHCLGVVIHAHAHMLSFPLNLCGQF